MPYAFGRIPDLADQRDIKFELRLRGALSLPDTLDLRAQDYGIDDQGDLGSCVGHGCEGAYRNLLAHAGLPDFDGSALAVYYAARVREKTTQVDAGCMIRTGAKVVNKTGIVPAELWPYDTSKFKRRPPKAAYAAAKQRTAHQYESVDNTNWTQCKAALAQNGNLIIGFTVYESFVSQSVAETGMVPMPNYREDVLGGHCMRAVGYTSTHLIVANSWGRQWGDNGYCFMPREMITNPYICDDFWTLVRI